ncbi:hypothetical protein ACG3SL_00405 [Sphingomonas sp. CJ20]
MRLAVMFVALAFVAPALAHADDGQEKERKICRSDAQKTGSIMPPKKVCHTKAEWAAIDRANGLQHENRQRTDGGTPLRPDAG